MIAAAIARARAAQAAGRLVTARDAFAAIVAAEPRAAEAWSGLGGVRIQLGDHAGGLEALERAVELEPHHPVPRSALILALAHSPQGTAARLRAIAEGWWSACGAPVAPTPPPVWKFPQGRRVRIGYLGDGFCAHPVRFLAGWIIAHDRSRFEITVYDSSPRHDANTDQLRGGVDQWRNVGGFDDQTLAAQVRADGIDVLVDLNGHSCRHRLGVLSRRPAPLVGVALAFGTTGIPGAFTVVDDTHAPPGAEVQFTEHLIRLPSAVTFLPAIYAPNVAPPPSLAAGFATFGVMDRLAKITPAALDAWGRILAAVPDSRLLMVGIGFTEPEICQRLAAALAIHGVAPGRLQFEAERRHHDFLATYRRIDILLSPFPYSSGTTALESMNQGVPVVTLAGEGMHARHAAAHLAAVGLADLVATDVESYITTAVMLARDPQRLAVLRDELRPRLLASAVCDATAQARAFEAALEAMK